MQEFLGRQLPASPAGQLRFRDPARLRLGLQGALHAEQIQLLPRQVHQGNLNNTAIEL